MNHRLSLTRGFTPPVAGFTLIEMMVSVAIFTFVMVIALGALLSMSEADRKAQSLNTSINNLSAAVDSMSRTLRYGTTYHCGTGGSITNPQDCAAQPYISFVAGDGSSVVYCLSNGSANTCNDSPTCPLGSSCSILRSVNGGVFVPLTSPDVIVSRLSFFVVGALPAPGDNRQPKVTLLVSGFVPVKGKPASVDNCADAGVQCSKFNVQTSVTQRIYDQ